MLYLSRVEHPTDVKQDTPNLGRPLMVSTVLNMHHFGKQYTIKVPYSSAPVNQLVHTRILKT